MAKKEKKPSKTVVKTETVEDVKPNVLEDDATDKMERPVKAENVKKEDDAKTESDSKPDFDGVPTIKKESSEEDEESTTKLIGSELGSKLRDPGHRWSSRVPDVCLLEECILGIDEAGRGPVLGPMVYGTCYVPRSQEGKLRELGCMDSKMLTEGKREILFAKLNSECTSFAGWGITVLPPSWICESQLKRTKYNLNAISHDAAMGLIQGVIDLGVNLVEVYLDTVGDPTKYRDLILSRFPRLKVRVEKKADSTFPCVSAASIAAKVSRDVIVQNWTFPESISTPKSGYGSGYPGDPNTKAFLSDSLDKVFGFSSFVRFSWSTIAVILENKAHRVKWDDDDEEEGGSKKKKAMEKPAGTAALSTYFGTKRKADEVYDDEDEDRTNRRRAQEKERHQRKRHRFFSLKGLSLTHPKSLVETQS